MITISWEVLAFVAALNLGLLVMIRDASERARADRNQIERDFVNSQRRGFEAGLELAKLARQSSHASPSSPEKISE